MIEVREADSADVPALQRLFTQLDQWHAHHLPERFRFLAHAPREEAYLQSLIDNPEITLFVAVHTRDDGARDVIGLADARLRDAPDFPLFRPRRFAVVHNAVVAEAWRGRGVGRQLMAAVHAWAAAHDAEEVELEVYAFNDSAIAFYEALGYRPLRHTLALRLHDPPNPH